MPDDPISNPGIPPINPVKPPAGGMPSLGSGEEAAPKPFSLPPTPLPAQGPQLAPTSDKPTPMEAVREGMGQKNTLEEVQNHGKNLLEKIAKAQNLYSNPANAQGLTPEHFDAMTQTASKLGVDMQKIAKHTNQTFEPEQRSKGGSVLKYILNYLNNSQGTAQNALEFLSTAKNPSVAQMLSVQYAMQRASQKVELLSSVIGSSVSGIKTLMSTQL